jgi:4-amino-4-deoxy-L-arabinose transferase-like glycosyltransferase
MLHGAGARPFTLNIRLHMGEQNPLDSRTLALQHGEQTLARFALQPAPGWRHYRVLLPAGAATSSGLQTLPLELKTETYVPGGHDGRELGFPIDLVRVVPLDLPPASSGWLLLRALWLAWVLALVYGWLWRGYVALTGFHSRVDTLPLLPAGIAAVALLIYHIPYTLAWALPFAPWVGGLATLALLVTWQHRAAPAPHSPLSIRHSPFSPRFSPLLLLALVFLLALGLRLYQIDNLPYGLWRDEARHGLVALRILQDPTYRPVYEPRGGVDLPGLGFYPFALALAAGGIHVWTLRLVTALAGALTVFPLYGLVCCLFGRRDVALLAAAFLAVSSWHLTMSRFSFPTIFDPLLSLTGLWLLCVGLKEGGAGDGRWATGNGAWGLRSGALLAAGACLGLALQTYHTGRIAPLVVGALALLLLLRRPQHWQPWLLGVAVWLLGFALAAVPLARYALQYPESFNQRVGSVALLSEESLHARAPLAVFDDSLGRHLLMFHVEGDSNGRHHAPDHPLLDPITGLGLLAGIVLLLRHWHDWRSLFLFAALAIRVAPSLLAVNGPHAMRSIGVVAFACVVAALGWIALLDLARRHLPAASTRYAALWGRALAPAVVGLALLFNAWTYFVAMPTEPRVWLSFYPIHTRIGVYLRDIADEQGSEALRRVYVQRGLTDNAVMRYLSYGLPVATFDDGVFSRPPQSGDQFVLSGYTYEQARAELAASLDLTPQPVARGPDLPGRDTPSFVVYEARSEAAER